MRGIMKSNMRLESLWLIQCPVQSGSMNAKKLSSLLHGTAVAVV